jgi:hypothetical protein
VWLFTGVTRLLAILSRGQRRWGFTAGSGRRPRSSRQGIKPPGQRRALGEYGVDLHRVAGVEVVAQGAQFALLGFDLGLAGGIGVCSVERQDAASDQWARSAPSTSWTASKRRP